MKGTELSISMVLGKGQVIVLMHDLNYSLTLAQSVILKGYLVGLFAEKEKTGAITNRW